MQLPELEFIQDTGVKTPSITKDATELPASFPSFPTCYSLGSWVHAERGQSWLDCEKWWDLRARCRGKTSISHWPELSLCTWCKGLGIGEGNEGLLGVRFCPEPSNQGSCWSMVSVMGCWNSSLASQPKFGHQYLKPETDHFLTKFMQVRLNSFKYLNTS